MTAAEEAMLGVMPTVGQIYLQFRRFRILDSLSITFSCWMTYGHIIFKAHPVDVLC